MDERTTRKKLIDAALTAAGWRVAPYARWQAGDRTSADAVEEFPTDSGPGDYLLYLDGRPVADIEAKKLEVGPQNVVEQAKRYARTLADSPFHFGAYRLPFVYATNGALIYTCDLRDTLTQTRQITRFHTPDALREFLARDLGAADLWLRTHLIADPDRYYQQEAIGAIENALRNGTRQMLIAMATGTGKTRMAIASIYRLLKSGYAKRVLFLVDRRALAAQAVGALAAYEPEPGLKFDRVYEVYSQRFRREDLEDDDTPSGVRFDPKVLPEEYLTRPSARHAFVYVCTIQRMRINLFGKPEGLEWGDRDDESDADLLDIPVHAFDLVIADECHRGYTASEESKWREVLEHFDGIRVGLTATPAAHTTAYFGRPTYEYGVQRAVADGYLVDYDPVLIQSDITLHGHFLRQGEEVGLRDTRTGQLRFEFMEDERALPPETLTRDWTAPDRDRKIVQELAQYLREQEADRGRFPKTLVFAENDLPHRSHAEQLVRFLREEFGRGDDFVQKITGAPNVDRPLEKIRRFRNRPAPGIVVTVDLLSTGVDIPALENIVFLRPVKSRILFEQMLGRGTRRCDPIHKTHFTVFDAVGVLEYFRRASEFTADPPARPTRPNREIVDDIYDNRDRDYNVRVLVKRLQRVAKNISAEGREQMKAFLPDGDIGAFARHLAKRLDEDWAGTMRVLRDSSFLAFLENYPRPKPVFIEALEAVDTVTSGFLFHTSDGRTLKPDDYIAAFSRFVRENPAQVEAIRILLDRPREWNTEALKELRSKLGAQPEKFTEDNLRRAYHHALADIISIVHYAAGGTDPLMSAEQRVELALKKVFGDRPLTPEQDKWLGLIRRHTDFPQAIWAGKYSVRAAPRFWPESWQNRQNRTRNTCQF
ncbi:MAG TPA: DEAD/DEAH box helicase family protein [Anaerolineales bacterium]|nr:DEAD/DEAH box helicase family protein [Anaerolineales bacterium]